MKFLRMPKDHLDFFVSVLPAFGEVYAPVRRGSGHAFDRPARWSDVDLEYARTILPPRKLFLPPREVTFVFDPRTGYSDLLAAAAQPRVLFGVHAYDILGLNILDRVFLEGAYPDPYYAARRRNTAVIGVDFQPDGSHFAGSVQADTVEAGFDLFLSDIGDAYLVLVGTSRGHDMVTMSGCLLEEPGAADFAEFKRRTGQRRESYRTQVDLTGFAEIFDMEYESGAWNELADRCLSCGACSFVCPTCYCFDVQDDVDLGSRAGRRTRVWDSCLFKTHAAVAGGENFRKGRSSRLKFRFYHKQRGFVAEYGRPSCVGCGRCSLACPAGIDIVEVIRAMRGETDAHADRATAAK
jgi:formate hydrogenlyase subunit 6/NADH:ubiquinone oxidoreductase subunit I